MRGARYKNLKEKDITLSIDKYVNERLKQYNDVETQIGQNHRKAFVNSTSGREAIAEYLTEPYLSSVMAVWGDLPTVIDEDTIPSMEE